MIESIFGPMFSGKTSELMRKINRHRLAKKKCLVINFKMDDRYSTEEKIVSHDQIMIDAMKVKTLNDIPQKLIDSSEVIGIDEAQFFRNLIDKAQEWANQGKIVIIAALDCTFQMKPFNKVTDLLAISEHVKKLSAVCMDCGKNAFFTKRITSEMGVELIGGLDIYKPVCRACFYCDEVSTPKKKMQRTNATVGEFSETDKENCNQLLVKTAKVKII